MLERGKVYLGKPAAGALEIKQRNHAAERNGLQLSTGAREYKDIPLYDCDL